MNKYNDLLHILDSLSEEAPDEYKSYHPSNDNKQGLDVARSRSYIHLFLKVKLGLIEFADREKYITDGPNDGGIDAYYIDTENKTIYYIQSKFRTTEANFNNKTIDVKELLAMDIDRIEDGEKEDGNGYQYNGKIQKMIIDLSSISDMPRWRTSVIILANVSNKWESKLKSFTGGYAPNVYNYNKVYNELVFPLVSGTYYHSSEQKITIQIDKAAGGSRIQYSPDLDNSMNCTVNVIFVPTIEIARILYKYKNSILKFNPRSYLNLKKCPVNEEIASSILTTNTNEFALYNNGITMLADDTQYSETTMRKNLAELIVVNPQIINGGQTAYTLSILYEQYKDQDDGLNIFANKDVLLKIINFNDSDSKTNKLKLIEKISIATNQQSPVSEADRRSNDHVQIEMQKLIYEHFDLFYERKTGEFGDGISKGYIQRNNIIDRDEFLRVCYAINSNPAKARSSSSNIIFRKDKFDSILPDCKDYRREVFAYLCYTVTKDVAKGMNNEANLARYAITYVAAKHFDQSLDDENFNIEARNVITRIVSMWNQFESYVRTTEQNKQKYFKSSKDSQGQLVVDANWSGYYKGITLLADLKHFFNNK